MVKIVAIAGHSSDQPVQQLLSPRSKNNVKRLIWAADLKCWFVSLFDKPPNVLPTLIFLAPSCLGTALPTQSTPNFRAYTLVGFDTEFIMARDMKNFKFAVPMPAHSMGSCYPCYVQLAFPNGTMFVFETFTGIPEDWTMLFSLVHGKYTIVISFDGANNWVGIYALLGTQFRTNCQKKNKDPVVKAIHFNAYQPDILAYAALEAFYPILLFPAFGRYRFIQKVYNAPSLYPHDSLEATKTDRLAETLIAAFHNISLTDVLPIGLIQQSRKSPYRP
uniref:Uncharacterized protein n=1 Tax=Romanomermis culicivorax TaxID=13658 RepID=A0A915IVY5_ROMCU